VRGAGLDGAIGVVSPIVADVRARGDEAVLEWTERFDGPRPDGFRVSAAAIAEASVDDDVLRALRAMILAVRTFSEAQRPIDTSVEAAPGIVSERRWLPLDSVGICVPSGTFPLPSSLVMAAVPALVAGVRRVAVVTPTPVPATLVVARELGLDEVYAIGGAQAVAALAYGTATIEAVDRIVGPGNAYVTAAKLLVSTRVGIDIPAGPSEVIVIADGWLRRWRGPRRSRPSTSSFTLPIPRLFSPVFGTLARCSSVARPSSGTTQRERRTCFLRAGSRAPPAASASRCS